MVFAAGLQEAGGSLLPQLGRARRPDTARSADCYLDFGVSYGMHLSSIVRSHDDHHKICSRRCRR